jgi:hypothetical protein
MNRTLPAVLYIMLHLGFWVAGLNIPVYIDDVSIAEEVLPLSRN